jgi:hypothetical protein
VELMTVKPWRPVFTRFFIPVITGLRSL